MSRLTRGVTVLAVALLVSPLVPRDTLAQVTDPVEPRAGGWKTWVLTSGAELRLPGPPDTAATQAELAEVQALVARRDASALDRIRYWDAGSPAYRWQELMAEASVRATTSTPGAKAFALLSVAIYDAVVAAWDSKYMYNRRRPSELDPGLPMVVERPRTPGYPSEHAVVAGAASTVLEYLWPGDATRFRAQAEEAARSRVEAGVQFPSDAKAGLDLGRAIGARVVERAIKDASGPRWSGTMPTGPGIWTGVMPVGLDEATLPTWVLPSPSAVRPGPPPAPDSAERAAELAEVKMFLRTPGMQGKVLFWNHGQYGMPGTHLYWSREVSRKIFEDRLDGNAPRAARAYALVAVAHYDAAIASQDAKFTYWTARPTQFDPTITTSIATPPHPSYPSNAAAFMKAPAEVMAYLFPQDAERFRWAGEEFGETRLWAGIHFRSDIEAGFAIGRAVAAKVIERAKRDGAQ
jgi:membrane-associated phospholipid phosphatase